MVHQHHPRETRRRSRNQVDHENIANVEWITSQTHRNSTNHHAQSENTKEVFCGISFRREWSKKPLIGARAAQEMELITVNDENFIVTLPLPRRNELQVKQITTDELIKQYSDVFDRPLGTLPGEVHLEVDNSVKPVITPTRRVPTALKDELKEELIRYIEQEILTPVEEPVPWVSSLAVATKKSGALRVCIDPRPLNEALKRETYQIPILDEILPESSQAKVFSTVDLRSGYWHCVLDHESSLLTMFSTPFGRYCWCWLPFGLSVSSEIFQKRVNQALEDLSGVLDIADDILVYGIKKQQTRSHCRPQQEPWSLLRRCREHNISTETS